MLRKLLFAAGALVVFFGDAASQPFQPAYNPVFDDRVLASIYIDIDASSLDSIMTHVFRDDEYPARFVFDNGSIRDTVENVGFRLRGATARTPPKKSYKISFNTFERGRKFYGLEKLNVNSEHNDPSIIRTKLGWDLFADLAVPATRANHVKLYVNGLYYGLYMNVEHIDEQFLKSRFGNDDGNLYKCLYPADLAYRGPDAASYRPLGSDRRPYDLTQGASDEEGYEDLAHFIDVLNNTPDEFFREEIEKIFDVNGYLRTMAADVVLGNWDNYWYLKSNFYLYNNPETGRFHFIPYDIDNTFGVDFVDEDWGRRDPYKWGHPSEPRPLAERILKISEYRDRYTFYLRRLIEGSARPVALSTHANEIRSMIEDAAESDPFHRLQWGWGPDSFRRSYTEAIGGHVEYGLYPFIITRTNVALGQLEHVDVVPILSSAQHDPSRPAASDSIRISVLVEDELPSVLVQLHYRLSDGTRVTQPMHDDGFGGDHIPCDGYFSATIPAFRRSGVLTYHVTATDDAAQTAVTKERRLNIGHQGPALFINEIMALNETTLADPFGEYDDWVEIYNAADAAVSLAGYTLTDNLDNSSKWSFPDVTIPAGGFLLIWTDGQPEQGPLHTPFRLDRDGEQVGLYDSTAAAVSSFSFGEQQPDVAYGRDPDGSDDLVLLSRATPGSSNNGTAVAVERPDGDSKFSLHAFPNPFSAVLSVDLDLPREGEIAIDVFDVLGRHVRRLAEGNYPAGPLSLTWDGKDGSGTRLGSGVYLLRITEADASAIATRSIVIAR